MQERRKELVAIAQKLPSYQGLTPAGRDYVLRAITGEPSRKTGKKALLSNSGTIAARKSYCSLQHDSESCEEAYLLLSEMDPKVAFVLDQPPQLALAAKDRLGRRRITNYTADFLELSSDGICLIEAKTLKDLEEKSRTYPSTWIQGKDHAWSYLPALAMARSLGMGFKVFNADAYTKVYRGNLQYLVRAQRASLDGLEFQTSKVFEALRNGPLSIQQLSARYGKINGSILVKLVLTGRLHALTDVQTIDADFLIYRTAEEADCAREQLRNMQMDDGRPGPWMMRLLRATKTEMFGADQAMEKYPWDFGAGSNANSTAYRYRPRVAAALAEGAPVVAAFLPDYSGRGGKGPELPEDAKKIYCKFLKKEYIKNERGQARPSTALAEFEAKHKDGNVYIPSQETARKWFHETFIKEKLALLNGGVRPFHQSRSKTDGKHVNVRPKIGGIHVHIDACYGDNVPVLGELAFSGARLIVLPMIDAATSCVIARGYELGAPSRFGSASALRDCIIRNGFIPATCIADWGSENENALLDEAIAKFRGNRKRRPIASSRSGAHVESLNASLNKYLQSYDGGTYFNAKGRSADGSKKGQATSNISLSKLIEIIDYWLFNIWNKTPIGSNTKSPEQLFEESLSLFPDAINKLRDTPFSRYYTSVPIVAKLDYTRGMRWGSKRYFSDEVRDVLREEKEVSSPRIDPFEPSTIWLLGPKGPVSICSSDHARIAGMNTGLRLEELRKLRFYNRVAKANQKKKRNKEAEARRDENKGAVVDIAQVEPEAMANKRSVDDHANDRGKDLFDEVIAERKAG